MVTITSPVKNSKFTTGANITITANASQTNGSIVSVTFLNGTTALGTSTAAPYSYTIVNAQPGTYTLTAKARDFKNTFSQSIAVVITVSDPP